MLELSDDFKATIIIQIKIKKNILVISESIRNFHRKIENINKRTKGKF